MEQGRNRIWWLVALSVCVGLIAVVALFTPYSVVAQGNPTPNSPSPEEVLAAANDAAARADNAVNVVNTQLQFISVVGLAFTGLFAVGGFLLAREAFRNLRNYGSELDSARSELRKLRDALEEQTKAAEQTLKDVDERIGIGLAEVYARGDKAIRALALLQLGEQQMEARNTRAALQTYMEAYQLDPNNRATNFFLGELYILQRDMVKGIEHLERTKNEHGDLYPPAEAGLAYALRVQAEQSQDPDERNRLYSEAEGHFIHALKIDPNMRDINDESFYGALGGLYRRRGQNDDAIRCYEEAERVTPHSAYPVNNLAMLYFLKGNTEKAERYFRKSKAMAERALEVQPGDYWQRFNVITALTAMADKDGAVDWLATVKSVLPSAGPLESLIGGLRSLNDAPTPPQGVNFVISEVEKLIDQIKTEQSQSK
ncbi:MAG: tetratricopeptide repeat protein [Anaerolineae bacterium]